MHPSTDQTHPPSQKIYHERQHLLHCGVHAINALLKRRAHTSSTLDQIADELAPSHTRSFWWHPHRWPLGLGNYDANVLMLALDRSGLRAEWLSPRVSVTELLRSTPDICGFLVNVPARFRWPAVHAVIPPGRHWIAVARYGQQFHVVDSRAGSPISLGDVDHIAPYIDKVRADSGHILYVANKHS